VEYFGDYDLAVLTRREKTFPVLRYLFYRHTFKKRMTAIFVPGCRNHNDLTCECDLHLVIKVDKIDTTEIIPRIKGGVRRTVAEMYQLANLHLVEKYEMTPSGIVSRKIPNPRIRHQFIFESGLPPSQVRIRGPMPRIKNRPPNTDVKNNIPEWIAKLCRLADIFYYTQYCGFSTEMIHNSWLESRHLRIDGLSGRDAACQYRLMELKDLLMMRMSFYNRLCCEWRGQPTIVCSTDNMTDEKVTKLYSEFKVDNVVRGPTFEYNRTLIPKALELFELMYDLKRFKGKSVWSFNPADLVVAMGQLATSAGLVDCDSADTPFGKISNSGRKSEMLLATMREVYNWLYRTAKGEIVHITTYDVIRMKIEMVITDMATEEALHKLRFKTREFFIPPYFLVMMGRLFQADRQKMERGVNRIGSVWAYGGAYEFAKLMNYDRDDVEWGTGDIYKLDKHIRDWILALYGAMLTYFMDYDKMTEEDVFIHKRAIEEMVFNLVTKITCHVDAVWCVMVGSMYSGGFETSNGDTWVMIFAYCMFIAHEIERHPHDAADIKRMMLAGILIMVAYGDDHLASWPKKYSYLNHYNFARFCERYLGLIMRDTKMHKIFLSEVNRAGELVSAGPVFLKRYFIASPHQHTAPVLPFRPARQSIMKWLTTSSCTSAELLLSSIGMAYDTYGANLPAYKTIEYCRHVIGKEDPRTPREIYNAYKDDPKMSAIIVRMTKKIGISAHEMFAKFPKYEYLVDRNIYDPARCKFTWHIGQDYAMYM